MVRPFAKVLVLLSVIGCGSMVASADTIGVGLLTFDANTLTAPAAFDILNLTGVNAFPPDFPVTTQVTISVTSLVANLLGGGTLTILGSHYSVVDPEGDVNCTDAGDANSGGCDVAAYSIVSATLTGTLSPLTGLAGLPAGDSGIASAFTTTITPNAGCGDDGGTNTTLTAGCDSAVINATGIPKTSSVPEPSTWILSVTALIGVLTACKVRGRAGPLKVGAF